MLDSDGGKISDQQKSALEKAASGGKVSQADYERAWADYKQCIIDKGYAEPTFDKYDNGIYALPSYNTDDASKEAIRKLNDDLTSCSMLHVTDINTVYRLQLGNPKLLLADGLTAKDVEVSLELPEQYLLGDDPAVYAVYTIRGGTKQESTSVKVPAKISGMADLLAQSTGAQLASSGDVAPGRSAWMLAGISLGCTAAAAVVTVLVMRLVNRIRRKKRRRSRPGPRHGN